MKAGRELDALVAEKVMGLKRVGEYTQIIAGVKTVTDPAFSLDNTTGYAPHYSTDIAAAWEVMETLKMAICFDDDTKKWRAAKDEFYLDTAKSESADTAPHAICLAALKAVGVDVTILQKI